MGVFNDSRVSVIETKLENHERYFVKLDESIEKLSDVSLSIKEMLIKHEGKLYRVYATCVSNCASLWILTKGEKLFIRN